MELSVCDELLAPLRKQEHKPKRRLTRQNEQNQITMRLYFCRVHEFDVTYTLHYTHTITVHMH